MDPAALVLSTVLPKRRSRERQGGIYERTTAGVRIYLATPRLRGLLALSLSVAGAGAMVIVNTVVYVQGVLERPEADVAVALALFGGGSMLAALLLPRVLDRLPDRPVMLAGGALLGGAMLFIGARSLHGVAGWRALLAVWFVLGLGYSTVLTPSGRLLRRSAREKDLPALFAAQFALSRNEATPPSWPRAFVRGSTRPGSRSGEFSAPGRAPSSSPASIRPGRRSIAPDGALQGPGSDDVCPTLVRARREHPAPPPSLASNRVHRTCLDRPSPASFARLGQGIHRR